MSNVEKNFRTFISTLVDIENVVADPNCSGIVIRPTGEWFYEKLGRIRSDRGAISSKQVCQIAENLGKGINLFGEWAVHKHKGADGALILFERRPITILERMSHRVSKTLVDAVRLPGDGLVVGPAGAGKSSILCWLAGQSIDESLLFVSEIPPSSLPGKHVVHVFPPKTNEDARTFERLIRLSSVVFWDRIRSESEMKMLLGNTNAKKRWFSFDIGLVKSKNEPFRKQLRKVIRWGTKEGLDLKTIFSLSKSTIGRSEPQSILVKRDTSWEEVFRKDSTYLLSLKKSKPSTPKPLADISSESLLELNNDILIREELEPGRATGVISSEALEALKDKNLRETTKQYSSWDIASLANNQKSRLNENEKPNDLQTDPQIQVLETLSELDVFDIEDIELSDYSSVAEIDDIEIHYPSFEENQPLSDSQIQSLQKPKNEER